MNDLEINLNELAEKARLSKRQITNWQKHGLLPEPIRRERTGRMEGEVVYYPVEAYYRLRSLKVFPVSSIAQKVGMDGIFLPLFAFGFRDGNLDDGIKRLFKKAIKHYQKIFRKYHKTKSINEIVDESNNDNLSQYLSAPLPFEILKPLLLRLSGESKSNIKKWFPLDSTDEFYDPISDYATQMGGQISMAFDINNYEGMEEDYINKVVKLIPNFPSLSESLKLIDSLNKRDLDYLQSSIIVNFLFAIQMGISPAKILELFRSSNFTYSCCLVCFFTFLLSVNFIPQMDQEFRDWFMAQPEEIKRISMEEEGPIKIKRKSGRK